MSDGKTPELIQTTSPRPNRAERRRMMAVAKSGKTKRAFGEIVELALRVFPTADEANTWVQTRNPQFENQSPMFVTLCGRGDEVKSHLRRTLSARKFMAEIEAGQQSATYSPPPEVTGTLQMEEACVAETPSVEASSEQISTK